MILHYLTMALRNLFRDKVFSLINILGLAVGMGVCLVIYQYIHFELSYDRFHRNAENTYRLLQTVTRNGEMLAAGAYTTHALGVRSKEDIPEVLQFVRVHPNYGGGIVTNPENNTAFKEKGMLFVDSNFLQVFDFPLKFGDSESALDGKYDIIITEKMATKYFGNTHPIGKILKVGGGYAGADYTVSGVLKTLPVNSHLQFDFLLPMKPLFTEDMDYKESSGWGWINFVTYIVMDEATDLAVVGEKFNRLISTYAVEELARTGQKWEIGFQPIAHVHLRSRQLEDPSGNNGDIQNVRFFTVVAIFILIIAWVNYINLSTARAIRRSKEVGIRKSIGALRGQLIGQFMIESFLINSIAALLAISLAILLLPSLNNIIGKELVFNVLQTPEFWTWFSTLIILGILLSGLYPAFVLSAFKPVSILKSVSAMPKGGLSLRRGLIVFQFLTSVLLISGTYLVYRQITFMKNRDLGIDMEKILVLNGPAVDLATQNPESRFRAFKTLAASHHSVSAVAGSGSIPGKGYNWQTDMHKVGGPAYAGQFIDIVYVDVDFTDTYDLHLLAGKPFPQTMFADQGPVNVIINEEAVKVFGLGSPQQALQEKLVIGEDTVGILAVLKNFHWNSLRDAHLPYLFAPYAKIGSYFSLRVDMANIRETIAHVESAYKSVFPDDPFAYFFLDDDFNKQYQADLQFGNLFSAFSVLAIFLACLGLYALVSFSATQRVKEIGIRKIFGAGTGNLMVLLSREYMALLLVANMLAVPAIIWGGRAWLDNYAFKIRIGVEPFFIPALVLMAISLLTVSYRTYTAAKTNPVESLRSE